MFRWVYDLINDSELSFTAKTALNNGKNVLHRNAGAFLMCKKRTRVQTRIEDSRNIPDIPRPGRSSPRSARHVTPVERRGQNDYGLPFRGVRSAFFDNRTDDFNY